MIKLAPGEEKKMIIRKSTLVLVVFGIFYGIIGLGPTIIAWLLLGNLSVSIDLPLLTLIFFVLLAWVFFVWLAFVVRWIDFDLDIWIVTSERIIDIEQKGLFGREVSTLRLDEIQDITIETYGVFFTILNVGHLRIQTAGSQNEFHLRFVRFPSLVKNKIQQAYRQKVEAPEKVTIVK